MMDVWWVTKDHWFISNLYGGYSGYNKWDLF